MKWLDKRGVAPITIIVIVVVSAGVTVGVPVAVDVADVDPDHPLYALERLGERIRMIGDEDQMKERWGEYARLVDRGKGLEYKEILEEFVEKMRICVPWDVAAKQEVVQWMQDQMPGIGRVHLKLCKEMLEKCKEDLPELEEELEDEIEAIEGYEELPTLPPELLEEIRARLHLIREKVEEHRARIREPIAVYFVIDDVLVDVDINVNVEVHISVEKPLDLVAEFEKLLDEFLEELAEIEAKLEGAAVELEIRPGVFKILQETHGLYAVKRLVEVAKDHKERAEAAFEPRKALGLIHAAKTNLKQAEEILEHALEWEEEHREIWEKHLQRFEEIKEKLVGELETGWENILEEYKGKLDELKQKIAVKIYENIRKAREEYVPQQIIVKFKQGVGEEVIFDVISRHGASVLYKSPYAGFMVLRIPQEKTVPEMVRVFSEDPNVEYAEPNYIYYALTGSK